jgi:hypothetical protein
MKFSMLQQHLLCRATRFFTTQKNFSHREMMAGVKKTDAGASVFRDSADLPA